MFLRLHITTSIDEKILIQVCQLDTQISVINIEIKKKYSQPSLDMKNKFKHFATSTMS